MLEMIAQGLYGTPALLFVQNLTVGYIAVMKKALFKQTDARAGQPQKPGQGGGGPGQRAKSLRAGQAAGQAAQIGALSIIPANGLWHR